MKHSRLHAAAVWAISAWPAFNFLSANWEEVVRNGAASLIGILISTLVIGTVGHVLRIFAARSGRGGFFVVVWLELICLFFGYAALRDACRTVFEAYGIGILPFAGFIVVSALVLGVTARFRNAEGLQFAATIFCLAAACISMSMLVVAALRFDAHPDGESAANVAGAGTRASTRGPNVYYIILDSYPGLRGLMSAAGIDNSAFMARMVARGFIDRSTERSNYLTTAQELGSIFALDYAETDDPRFSGNPAVLYPRLLERTVPPPLLARLKAAGYVSWQSASFWHDCPRKHFSCLGETAFVRFDRMAQAYFAPTPFGRPLLYLIGRRYDALASIALNLPALATSVRPIFVFGHHMSPHPPFLFDRNCQPYTAREVSWNDWNAGARQAFLDAITCVNSQVEKLVDAILSVDPDSLIVVQGDHGSAFGMDWMAPISSWSASSIGERASYLNLIRAPADCAQWLDRSLGQINTARFALGCAERRQPVYLPEKTYLSTYARGPEQGVVRRWSD